MVICDGCGTKDKVKRACVTLWNKNIFDLCYTCAEPIIKAIDSMNFTEWSDNA